MAAWGFERVQEGAIAQDRVASAWEVLWESAGFGGIEEDQIIKG